MKYSLKNVYKAILKEEPVRVITKDDVLTNKKVTRVYDLIAPDSYNPVDVLTIEPKEIIQHSEINDFLSRVGSSSNKNNFNRKKLKIDANSSMSESIRQNIKEIIFNSIFDTIETHVIRGFFRIDDFDNSYYDTLNKFSQDLIDDIDCNCLIQSIKSNIEKVCGDENFENLTFLKNIDLDLKDTISIKGHFKINLFSQKFNQICKQLIVSISTNNLTSASIAKSKEVLKEFSIILLNSAEKSTTSYGKSTLDILKTQLISSMTNIDNETKVSNLVDMITRFYTESTLFDVKSKNIFKKITNNEINIRQTPKNIEDAISILNNVDHKDIVSFEYNTRNRTGPGEYGIHLLLNTSNICSNIEPDAIIDSSSGPIRCSVKSIDGARTGENMSIELRRLLENFFLMFFKRESHSKIRPNIVKLATNVNYEFFSRIIEVISTKEFIPTKTSSKSKLSSYRNLFNEEDILSGKEIQKNENKIRSTLFLIKKEMLSEHESDYVLLYDKTSNNYRKVNLRNRTDIETSRIQAISGNRVSFTFNSNTDFNRAFNHIFSEIVKESKANGKNLLKEVFSNLYKKKIISEGGLAGHMMHPYEALDMTPRQIIDKIKEYSTSQEIIEKVDGQNLFFTVEEDGTLMFARNKQDMTHDDLVRKFTGHPAELPFIEGGNAIKQGVNQWLASAGDAAEMEIREIFHPDGETKSFINFEIMHPEKPNQIVYDEKYIVFHSIVDFINGREASYSTNKGERLAKLIRLMDSGVSASGFTLASNRTVNLNQLSNIQIEEYVNRIKEVTRQLGISEEEFLGDGIEKQIKFEIEKEGINISDEAASLIYDFAIYGKTKTGKKIKSKDFTSMMSKQDASKLRSIGLTSSTKALKKAHKVITPFKEIFVDLGIDLLQGVKSSYMSEETNQININLLKDKLQTAVDDLISYMKENSDDTWEPEVHRLMPHVNKVIDKDIDLIVSTAVEGGVYDYQGDLLKVTGGFAPMNQILGAAYRDKKGIFPTFKEKFMQKESKKMSLKNVYKILF